MRAILLVVVPAVCAGCVRMGFDKAGISATPDDHTLPTPDAPRDLSRGPTLDTPRDLSRVPTLDTPRDLSRHDTPRAEDVSRDRGATPKDQGARDTHIPGEHAPGADAAANICRESWTAWAPVKPCQGYLCCASCSFRGKTYTVRCNSGGACACTDGTITFICGGSMTCDTAWSNVCCSNL